MRTTQFFHQVAFLVTFLCFILVKARGTTQTFSRMTWLKDSVTDIEAEQFCTNILQVCKSTLKTFNTTHNVFSSTPKMCGISECCIFTSFNVRFPASECAAVDQKRKRFRNMCFAKWAFIELLAEDELTLSLVFSKFARLDAMEFKSKNTNIRERLQLEEELLQIAAFRLDLQTMPVHNKHRSIFRTISKLKSLHNHLYGSQSFRAHPIRDVKNSTRDGAASKVGFNLTSFRDEHERRIRSVGGMGCNQLVYTRLYTISGCVPKSILLWRCQGTCDSRSVPEWDAASSMVASVENCNCCSAGLLKSRTTVFVCPNRRIGNIPRTVTWPFRCSCRPCSNVPTIQQEG